MIDDAPYFLNDIEPGHFGEKYSSSNRLDDPVLSYMRANDGERENEELRGIIDDLTLDIKRLKQKLRRYKERDPPRLQGDKLFDVRTYGLPRHRKRQLEQILQQFAAEISGSSRLSRDKPASTKSKLVRDDTSISEDDARKALVAMLFKQHLGLSAAKASIQHLANTSPTPDPWYDLNETLGSIKQMVSTIDVEFSREALKKYGAALELSADGHRVRRHGSDPQGLTRPSTGPTAIHDHPHSHHTSDLLKKRSKYSETILGLAESKTTSLHKSTGTDYVPYTVTTHKNEADDEILSLISSDSEMSLHVPTSDRNGHFSNPQTHKKSHERLTYYKNATFYIDCFGDSPDVMTLQPRKSLLTENVGEKRKRQSSPGLSSQQRRHTNRTPADRFLSYPNEKDSVLNLSQCSSPVLSLAEEPLASVADGHKAFPKELAASGIGDVTPDDNFAVHVVTKHVPISSSDDAGGAINNRIKKAETQRGPDHSAKNAIPGRDQRKGRINDRNEKFFKTYVVAATHEELPPSSLPPATCGFFSSASSDDDSDGDEGREDGDDERHHAHENRRRLNRHDAPRDVLARVGIVNGELPASVHSIEKWNAHVVASLGNHGGNGLNEVAPQQTSGSIQTR